MPNVTVHKINYHDQSQVARLITLLDAYAQDPMGGGQALATEIKDKLLTELPKQAHLFSLIVQVDGVDAGFCDCCIGFSTFAAAPLVNIHDLAVLPDFRGMGLSKHLLNGVAGEAQILGAVKITLEVLANNDRAKHSYRNFGFKPYQLAENAGIAEFWQYYLN